VPFNLFGAVENMSRDWVIDKIAIGVTNDSDRFPTEAEQVRER